jgi:Fe-coproporphyrin III synthase
VRSAAALGARVGVRVTVQRSNYRQLPQFVTLTRQLGAQQLSFVAVDVANPHAFARGEQFAPDLALQPHDLPILEQTIDSLERGCVADFHSGLIADSPRKLRRIHQYFAALCGLASYPPVHCNVFDYSAVVGATGRISPCFFIAGPPQPHGFSQFERSLNSDDMIGLRARIRSGARAECARCVCSLWREPQQRQVADFLMR